MNTWIAGENLMKHHCQIKNFLERIKFGRYY